MLNTAIDQPRRPGHNAPRRRTVSPGPAQKPLPSERGCPFASSITKRTVEPNALFAISRAVWANAVLGASLRSNNEQKAIASVALVRDVMGSSTAIAQRLIFTVASQRKELKLFAAPMMSPRNETHLSGQEREDFRLAIV